MSNTAKQNILKDPGRTCFLPNNTTGGLSPNSFNKSWPTLASHPKRDILERCSDLDVKYYAFSWFHSCSIQYRFITKAISVLPLYLHPCSIDNRTNRICFDLVVLPHMGARIGTTTCLSWPITCWWSSSSNATLFFLRCNILLTARPILTRKQHHSNILHLLPLSLFALYYRGSFEYLNFFNQCLKFSAWLRHAMP